MARVVGFVVREGKKRGKGRYLAWGAGADAMWTARQGDAFMYGPERPIEDAAESRGRVVRIVRRAK